jgi:ATP-dependent protease HslVU (ClpYQ) peptidase subunit
MNMHGYDDCRTLNSDQIIASLYGTVQKMMGMIEKLEDEISILKGESMIYMQKQIENSEQQQIENSEQQQIENLEQQQTENLEQQQTENSEKQMDHLEQLYKKRRGALSRVRHKLKIIL